VPLVCFFFAQSFGALFYRLFFLSRLRVAACVTPQSFQQQGPYPAGPYRAHLATYVTPTRFYVHTHYVYSRDLPDSVWLFASLPRPRAVETRGRRVVCTNDISGRLHFV
jgi:hypothetical protein